MIRGKCACFRAKSVEVSGQLPTGKGGVSMGEPRFRYSTSRWTRSRPRRSRDSQEGMHAHQLEKCRMDMVVVSATGAGVRILRMGSGRATSFLGGVRQIFQVISRVGFNVGANAK